MHLCYHCLKFAADPVPPRTWRQRIFAWFAGPAMTCHLCHARFFEFL